MDIIVEILGEALGEIILEGGAAAVRDHRRPRWQRILVLSLLALFCAAVFVLIAAAGVIILGGSGRGSIAGVALLLLDAALVVYSVHKLRGILRTFSRK